MAGKALLQRFAKSCPSIFVAAFLLTMTGSSVAFWQQANPKAETPQSESAGRAETLVQQALLLTSAADQKPVDDRLSQAISLWMQIREPEKAALSYLLVGDSYKEKNLLREALHYYNRALEVKPISSQSRARGFNSMARVYQELYNFDLARTYYKKAIDQARLAKDISTQAEALIELATLHYQAGQLESARVYIEQAQQLNRRQRDDQREARLQHLTGQIAQEQGLMDKSREALNKALAIYQQTGDEPQCVLVLVSLSSLYLSSGQNQTALDYAQQAFDIAESKAKRLMRKAEMQRLRNQRWRARLALARAQRALGQKDKAKTSYLYSTSHIEAIWIAITASTSVGSSAFGEERQAAYRELVDLLIESGDAKEGFSQAELAKARALSATLNARRKNKSPIPTKYDEAIRRLSQSIANLRTQLMSRKLLPGERAGIEKQIEEDEVSLAEAQGNADMVRKDPAIWFRPLSADDIQKRLSRGKECLVEFLLGEKQSFAWFISSDQLFVETLPGRKEIEGDVNKYLDAINAQPNSLFLERHIAEQRSLSAKLFVKLFGRLSERLPTDEKLIIVPDGILYHLPFDSLIRNQRFLIEDEEITYLPSASLLELLTGSNSEYEGEDKMEFLGFGDPFFEPNPRRRNSSNTNSLRQVLRAYDDFHLTALPATRDEINEIAKLFDPSRSHIYLGKQNTEDAFKSELLRRYKRIHLATHSIVDERNPFRSSIVFNFDDDPQEDGFLDMSDIAGLDIDCDLVVLSACQTGRGQLLSGEGVIGFSRAFLCAGARSVVVSLWKVSDISTGQMMKNFYQQIVQGKENAAALREAKLQMIRSDKEAQHPYYWAPFILVGKP